jgi:hypothetical protein
MPELITFFWNSFWIVIASVIVTVFFLWLFIIQGEKYSIEDTEAHSEEYAEVIREGHGGMTLFLWASFATLFIWIVLYLVVTWEQFLIIGAAM